MWDTVVETSTHLSHEMPCPWCGHETHQFLACSDRCDCGGWSLSSGADSPAVSTSAGLVLAAVDVPIS